MVTSVMDKQNVQTVGSFLRRSILFSFYTWELDGITKNKAVKKEATVIGTTLYFVAVNVISEEGHDVRFDAD